ncbi:MAG TPA: phosphotransferase [Thermoanaerobaculia bacterium]|nr:phosphotransferase [Thermoanaerobaculia bacterium]
MLLLTARNVAPYLLERGLIPPEPWVDGDLRIVEVRRRCRSFKVLAGDLPGCFVKQIPDAEADSQAALAREAACLWLAREDPGLACLAPLLPRFRAFDPAHHILVTELLHPSASLAARHLRQGDLPPGLAALWGESLGAVHRDTAAAFASRPRSALFPGARPAFLTAHRGEAPPAGREWTPAEHVLAAVRGQTGFPAALEALCADWRPACLIHGDLRWDNVLLLETGAGAPALKLVDWELADLGDPGWDVGSVLESYLSAWALSLPAESGLGPERLVERAGHPLERVLPAVQAFWQAYADALEIAPRDRLPALERSLRFAAARMVQTAYESARQGRHSLPRVLALLQVSLNVLASPGGAREELLGL